MPISLAGLCFYYLTMHSILCHWHCQTFCKHLPPLFTFHFMIFWTNKCIYFYINKKTDFLFAITVIQLCAGKPGYSPPPPLPPKSLICSICQYLQYKYFHYGWFLAANWHDCKIPECLTGSSHNLYRQVPADYCYIAFRFRKFFSMTRSSKYMCMCSQEKFLSYFTFFITQGIYVNWIESKNINQ